MKRRTRRGPRMRGEAMKTLRERVRKNGVIKPDRLLKEVREANKHIANPAERERVVPSRPC